MLGRVGEGGMEEKDFLPLYAEMNRFIVARGPRSEHQPVLASCA